MRRTAATPCPTQDVYKRQAVTYGMNISAIVKSIVNKVTFTVEQATGLEVVKVNVFVDEVKAE